MTRAAARIDVRVHPGAKRNTVKGWAADGALRLEVTAPPEGGRANQAVCDLIAATLGVRRQDVSVVRGESSRGKQIEIAGLEPEQVRARLSERINQGERRGG